MRIAGLFLLCACYAPAYSAPSEADRVWQALKNRNPAISDNARPFVQAYVPVLVETLKPLDNFVAVISGKEKQACNLLCEEHFVPAFFAQDDVSVADLVAYAFTATCYGLLPGTRHRERALEEFEATLRAFVGPYRTTAVPRSAYRAIAGTYRDRVVLHRAVGDALFAVEPHIGGNGRAVGHVLVKSRFPYIRALWQNTPLGRGATIKVAHLPPSEPFLKATAEACRAAAPK
jgi:hypothetical protein